MFSHRVGDPSVQIWLPTLSVSPFNVAENLRSVRPKYVSIQCKLQSKPHFNILRCQTFVDSLPSAAAFV